MGKNQVSFYIIEDISKWTIGEFSPLTRYDSLDEAIKVFKDFRKNKYDYSDGKAKLVLGAKINNSEIDVVHVRNDKNYLVNDFSNIDTFSKNKEFLNNLSKISDQIGLDRVRIYEKGSSKYKDINFKEYRNTLDNKKKETNLVQKLLNNASEKSKNHNKNITTKKSGREKTYGSK